MKSIWKKCLGLTASLLAVSAQAADSPGNEIIARSAGQPLATLERPVIGTHPAAVTLERPRPSNFAVQQVIYQQPCYCYCDRGHGHKSLHSCFESEHGGNCAVCMKELYYSYQMIQQKKTPEQIRMGIVSGEWQQVNLDTAASIGLTPKTGVTLKTPVHKTAAKGSKKSPTT